MSFKFAFEFETHLFYVANKWANKIDRWSTHHLTMMLLMMLFYFWVGLHSFVEAWGWCAGATSLINWLIEWVSEWSTASSISAPSFIEAGSLSMLYTRFCRYIRVFWTNLLWQYMRHRYSDQLFSSSTITFDRLQLLFMAKIPGIIV